VGVAEAWGLDCPYFWVNSVDGRLRSAEGVRKRQIIPVPTHDSTESILTESPLDISPPVEEQLREFLKLLLRTAQLFNLTAITDPERAWDRHVVESLRLLPLLGPGKRLIDVGSGAGLPGMVLAIARPTLAVTLLEATAKKARFLEETAKALALSNVAVVANRAELAAAVGQPLRESFDIVTARAVAPLRILVELTAPFARVGGTIVAVKGRQAEAELASANNALFSLHVEHEATVRQPTATIIVLRKKLSTPAKYPRRSGEPKHHAL